MAPPFLTSSARAGALLGAVVGGESPACWRGAASRCSLPQGRGPRAVSRWAGRAIEDGASNGEVEDGGTRAFPSRAGRAELTSTKMSAQARAEEGRATGTGEGGGGASAEEGH